MLFCHYCEIWGVAETFVIDPELDNLVIPCSLPSESLVVKFHFFPFGASCSFHVAHFSVLVNQEQ
ncbi:hypothetical protein SLEP1_g25582 [Rubroshorea leprosula]|uniref:Uncharacterized protein n=1 Tax=Rubroshorea leprosula TaxID=152421 RepID=A0AAV5JVL3_9ROSI|nr:hypothetical protein SLEP1_g25582 [Rubroshorea leprosula]